MTQPSTLPAESLFKGFLRAYYVGTHTADVQLAASTIQTLDGIRVATHIHAVDCVVDRECTVLFFDASNPSDAIVIGVQGALPGSPASDPTVRAIALTIDGGGSAITTGIKADVEIPFACTIDRVTLLADQSGSIVIDIWKDTYANYPPTDADSITASAPPTISSATKSQDATLTGWTKTIAAGSTLRFNVDSCTTITRLTLILKATVT